MEKSIDSHGYVIFYNPSHHKAKQNGMVYEHVLVAEEILGRELSELEVVHHEDRNRSNNNKDNLFVFATKEDHVRYHHNGMMVKVGDTYIAPSSSKKSVCEICNKEFEFYPNQQTGKHCSRECSGKSQQRVERPSKEELLIMIKSMPFTHIAKKYNVSDNSIRKWCKIYELPYRAKDVKNFLAD